MPRSLLAGFITALQGGSTALALCWKVTLRDATVLGFTTHVEDLVVDSVTYKANSGVAPTSVVAKLGSGVDNNQLLGFFAVGGIEEDDILKGIYKNADVLEFLVFHDDLALGTLILLAGKIGEVVARGDGSYEIEARDISQLLGQTFVPLTQPSCRVKELGDAECGKNLATFTHTGEVDSVTSTRRFIDAAQIGRATTNGVTYFEGGKLTWTSGANAGVVVAIKSFNTLTGEFVLQLPMRSAIAVGDDFTAIAGCNRQIDQCNDKFDNVLRYQGEDSIPGNDYLIRSAK